MSSPIKINGHGHLLPYPGEVPDFMKEKKIFWIDAEGRFMCQGDWKRPITDPSFFLREKLEWMDKNDIAHEVILNLSQLYCNGMDRETTRDVIRFQNDFNARVQRENPSRFTAGFVVQVAYLEDALAEVERCVKELDLRLLCLPTHFLDKNGQWCSVADPVAEPLFQLADDYGLAMEIHPYDGPRMIGLRDQFWRFHLVWMCAQTADTYHCYTLLGYPQKFPNLRVCFAHGNQFGQVNIGRRVQGFTGRPDLFRGTIDPRESVALSNLYFDTLVHDAHSFRLLADRQGAGQIIAGLDDPYPLGEMESVPGCYPGKVIDEALALGFITEKEKNEIWYDNVINWLCGEEQDTFKARLNRTIK